MKGLMSVLVATTILALTVMVGSACAQVVKAFDNVGGIYETEAFQEGIKVFTDRNHLFKQIPQQYLGATYIRCPVTSVRETPKIDITVELETRCQVYILWYTEDKWKGAKPAGPTDWLKKDYDKTEAVVVWGPEGGTDYNFNPWKSKTVFRPGEFHTYTTGNDCAYGIFVEEASAVEPSNKLSTMWSNIKRID